MRAWDGIQLLKSKAEFQETGGSVEESDIEESDIQELRGWAGQRPAVPSAPRDSLETLQVMRWCPGLGPVSTWCLVFRFSLLRSGSWPGSPGSGGVPLTRLQSCVGPGPWMRTLKFPLLRRGQGGLAGSCPQWGSSHYLSLLKMFPEERKALSQLPARGEEQSRGGSLAAPPENFSKSLSMLTSQPDREAEGACPGPIHSPNGDQGLGEVFSGCLGPPSCTRERRGLLNQGRRISLSRVRGAWGRHPGLATGIQEVTADSRTS